MEFHREVLGNGIRLVYSLMPQLLSATFMVGFKAGGRHEDGATPGIAHFAEHIAFKGTRRHPTAESIINAFKDFGAHANAGTSSEMTMFYVKSLAADFAEALQLIEEIALEPAFTEDMVRVESGVITQELKRELDDLDDQTESIIDRLTFGSHPLGGSLLGTLESISAITADDLYGFRRRWYTTDRTVVGLAGNLGDRALEDVRQRLEAMPASSC